MIDKAIRFAVVIHEGQTRKGTDTPDFFHPLEAGVIAAGMVFDGYHEFEQHVRSVSGEERGPWTGGWQ